MIYELLDTAEHPLVVVGTLEDADIKHPPGCSCGGRGATKALKVAILGAAPVGLKAMGLLTAVSTILADEDTDVEDCRMIRRALAKLLEVSS